MRRRRGRWVLAGVAALFLITGVSAYGLSQPAQSGPPTATLGTRHTPPAASAQVTISGGGAMQAVPSSFLGVSTEYWALPQWSTQMPLLERVLSLIHAPGQGPLILRVGGDSADHSFWDPDADPMPRWAFTLAPQWLHQAAALVHSQGVRLILDLNLITDTPGAAAAWARAAESALPRHSIIAFEIGNEPDIYSRADWLAITAGKPLDDHALPAALTAADYVRDFRAYAAALRQVAPDVPLAGPALARPASHAAWISALLAGARRYVGVVTVHRYPYSACVGPRSPAFPTVSRVLSPHAAEAMADALAPSIDTANDAGLALRMTELNSVTCGGRPGVSDAFATALWAPDALFSLLRVGVDGVNIHVRADTINAPFALTAAGLDARPLLYGLILFSRALGPHARMVSPAVHVPATVNFRAYGVRVGRDTLHVVLIDKSRRAVRVTLRLPATGTASVQRLVAPSPGSTTGTTLGGRSLAADGSWQGRPIRQLVVRRDDRYTIDVRRFSAALVSVRVAPGALGAPRAAPPATRATDAAPAAPARGEPRSSTDARPRDVAGRAPRAAASRRR